MQDAASKPGAMAPITLDMYKYAYPGEQNSHIWQMYTALGPLLLGLERRTFITGSIAEGLHLPPNQQQTSCSHVTADAVFLRPLQISQNHEACCSGQPLDINIDSADRLYVELSVKCHGLKEAIGKKCPSHDGTYLPWGYIDVTERPSDFSDFGDHPQSIAFATWPEPIQSEWLHRLRPHGWPSKALVERITEVKVVATPSVRAGDKRDRTWRLSFLMAERLLAVSLTASQRNTFVLWKLLLRELPATKFLRTFQLKAVFFWVCENQHPEIWRASNIATCLKILCDALSKCVASKFIGSFFVPDSNLLGEDDELVAAEVCGQLNRAGGAPFSYLRSGLTRVLSLSSFMLQSIIYEIIMSPSFYSPLNAACRAAKALLSIIGRCKVGSGARTLYHRFACEVGAVNSHSLLGRLLVDSWNMTTSRVPGDWRLSTEVAKFREYCSRLYEEARYVPSQRMRLMVEALYKMKLRGLDPLETGSFVPTVEYQYKLVTASFFQLTGKSPEEICGLANSIYQLQPRSTKKPTVQQPPATAEKLYGMPEKVSEASAAASDVLDICKYAHASEHTCRDWYQSAVPVQAVTAAFVRGGPKIFIAGSRAEGLHVTEYLQLESGSTAIADWDMMIPAGLNQNHAGCCDSQPLDIHLDPADRRYAELFIKCESLRKSVIEALPDHDGSYVPRSYIRISEPLPTCGDVSASVSHGPAELRTSHPDHAKKFAGIQRNIILHLDKSAPVSVDIDHVQAVVLDTWPEPIKENWLRRPRPHGWPSEAMVKRVTKEKVMATLTGRPGENGDRTWRLSFSMAERVLSLSLTATQRTTFLHWKLLLKEMPATKVLRSFYLKNVLYWVCENQPAGMWSAEHMETCLRTLCNSLSECVASNRIRSFFVPNSNLLNGENIDAAAVCEDLKRLGSNLSHHLQRISGRAFGMGSVTLAFDAHKFTARLNLGCSSPELTLDAAGKAAKFLMMCLKFHKVARDDDSLDNLCFLNVDEICWHSLISRLIIDSWSNKRRSPATGEYRLSDDLAKFQEYFRRVYETADCFPSRRIKLMAEAFYKMKLRGQDPLDTGAFIPFLEYQYKVSLLMSSGILKRKPTKAACKYIEDEVD